MPRRNINAVGVDLRRRDPSDAGSIRRSHVWPDGPPNPDEWRYADREPDRIRRWPEFPDKAARPAPTRPSWDEMKRDALDRGFHPSAVSTMLMRQLAVADAARPARAAAGTARLVERRVQAPKRPKLRRAVPPVATRDERMGWSQGLSEAMRRLEEAS